MPLQYMTQLILFISMFFYSLSPLLAKDTDTQVIKATSLPLAALAKGSLPEKGLCWEISKPGQASSYLFGTIHSEDQRVLQLPDSVRQKFDKASSLSLEIQMGDEVIEKLAGTLFLPDSENLILLLGKEDFKKLFQTMSQHGMLVNIAMRLKPWVAMMIVMMPKTKTGLFLDKYLQEQAKVQNKAIYSLESVEEQLAIFDSLSLDKQVRLLRATVKYLDNIPEYLENMHTLYLAQDLAGMEKLSNEMMKTEDPELEALNLRLMQHMLSKRNHVMVHRMQARLQEGNAFIAVGALHLVGKEGLISLLQQQGYQLRRID
ncbi:TraB/GumN family protein [Candidatus Venteria ishoeyi]|uniref:TraB family protein n=1 Tax=Candidatus Venteria ishoeyi TaxID=1899563 RepID=A0A1H6F5Z8_9GAMM|nr:TraB/GumN family protein [Candidatus Venteria ishoeyi]SEH05598.1 TraB family protein [Candidatus Venteria ishoeyi]SEH07061.1 TraB family protein [Candidatus Venteria ishoeyi]